ncbi:MAG: hypothetical protein QF595_12610, partial [Dehalococcoidia bacterium]|nr:hypothetical protein [Dehalococcoidia bacterium]
SGGEKMNGMVENPRVINSAGFFGVHTPIPTGGWLDPGLPVSPHPGAVPLTSFATDDQFHLR